MNSIGLVKIVLELCNFYYRYIIFINIYKFIFIFSWGEAGYFKIVISKTHSLNIGLTCGWAVSEIVEENYEDEINI